MATPTSAINISGGVKRNGQPSLTWKIDKATNRIVGETEGLDSVRQCVEILLNTDRYRWQIFRPYTGVELQNLIGQDRAYVKAELQRRIKDALSTDDKIQSVGNFSFVDDGDALHVAFDVISVYGSFPAEMEVVV